MPVEHDPLLQHQRLEQDECALTERVHQLAEGSAHVQSRLCQLTSERDLKRCSEVTSKMFVSRKSRWLNRARVTTPSLSRMGPKTGFGERGRRRPSALLSESRLLPSRADPRRRSGDYMKCQKLCSGWVNWGQGGSRSSLRPIDVRHPGVRGREVRCRCLHHHRIFHLDKNSIRGPTRWLKSTRAMPRTKGPVCGPRRVDSGRAFLE